MSNNLTRYQSQSPATTTRQASRNLARVQTDVAHIAAVANVAHQAIGYVYREGVSTVTRDLDYMNEHVAQSMERGMPPGQAEMIVEDTHRYVAYQSAVMEDAASRIVNIARERAELPPPNIIDHLFG